MIYYNRLLTQNTHPLLFLKVHTFLSTLEGSKGGGGGYGGSGGGGGGGGGEGGSVVESGVMSTADYAEAIESAVQLCA